MTDQEITEIKVKPLKPPVDLTSKLIKDRLMTEAEFKKNYPDTYKMYEDMGKRVKDNYYKEFPKPVTHPKLKEFFKGFLIPLENDTWFVDLPKCNRRFKQPLVKNWNTVKYNMPDWEYEKHKFFGLQLFALDLIVVDDDTHKTPASTKGAMILRLAKERSKFTLQSQNGLHTLFRQNCEKKIAGIKFSGGELLGHKNQIALYDKIPHWISEGGYECIEDVLNDIPTIPDEIITSAREDKPSSPQKRKKKQETKLSLKKGKIVPLYIQKNPEIDPEGTRHNFLIARLSAAWAKNNIQAFNEARVRAKQSGLSDSEISTAEDWVKENLSQEPLPEFNEKPKNLPQKPLTELVKNKQTNKTKEIKIASKEKKQVKWLNNWEGWFPKNEMILFYGDTGLGKSKLVQDIGCELIKGDSNLIIIYQSSENNPEFSTNHSLEYKGFYKDEKLLDRFICIERDQPLNDGVKFIREQKKTSEIVVILDPPVEIIDDKNKDSDVVKQLNQYEKIIKEHKVTFFIMSEERKLPPGLKKKGFYIVGDVDNYKGSKGAVYKTRVLVHYARIPDKSIIGKHLIAENKEGVKWDENKEKMVLLYRQKCSYAESLNECKAFLIKKDNITINDKSVSFGAVHFLKGLEDKTKDNILKQLGEDFDKEDHQKKEITKKKMTKNERVQGVVIRAFVENLFTEDIYPDGPRRSEIMDNIRMDYVSDSTLKRALQQLVKKGTLEATNHLEETSVNHYLRYQLSDHIKQKIS